MDDRYAHYRLIVDASDDAIITKNLEGVISSWNTGAQRMFGYTAAEAVGQPIAIIIPRELHEEEMEILRRLRTGERIEHYETYRVSKDGRRIDVSITVSPIKDAEGRIIGAFKIGRDITARKRAEAALREQEENFRVVADTVPAMIWMSGVDKLCTFFNLGWLHSQGGLSNPNWGTGGPRESTPKIYRDAWRLTREHSIGASRSGWSIDSGGTTESTVGFWIRAFRYLKRMVLLPATSVQA
jgi:PAS domain S-box-containing protein